jgi:adenylosuccinate lyase
LSIRAITPLDGRYASQIEGLADYLSEWALIRYRVLVEVEWLIEMAASPHISDLRELTSAEILALRDIHESFDDNAALRAKEIEATTRHDVKAVEYLIREQLQGTSLEDVSEWIHFCCTSEDINNLSYALMLKDALSQVWLPAAEDLVSAVAAMAEQARSIPLLARTHGQAATPTTMGKELAVFVHRWRRQLKQIGGAEYLGKFNGAVGSYNAHVIAYPNAPWEDISKRFVERLGLQHNPLTTQIETHDFLAEVFHALTRFNTVTMDFDKDVWSYISMGVLKQIPVAGEVGSSTMPHKVNPINFENSEANMGISNSLLEHLASKLLVSRLQRDLTDSSALRNLGPAIGHSLVGLKSAMRGLRQIAVDEVMVRAELAGSWEVLAEAVQTVMRKHGISDAYEQLKEFSRGAAIDQEGMQRFIKSLLLPEDDKKRLLALTPETYTGIASDLVRHISEG